MGDVLIMPGGGGADLDVITAGAGDVLAGRIIVDKEGEPVTGTMPNRGAWETSIGVNGSVTIPQGYHNGGGKITQSIPVQGGSTITPGTSNKTAVAAGRYVTGNVVLAGNSNLVAGNIRKGASIFGVSGAWEGYVSPIVFVNSAGLTSYSANGVTPMLYRGQPDNRSGIYTSNGYVQVTVYDKATVGPNPGLRWSGGVFNNAIIVSAYNYMSVTFSAEINKFNSTYLVSAGLNTDPKAFSQSGPNATGEYPCSKDAVVYTLTFNISNLSGWKYLSLYAAGNFESSYVFDMKVIEIRFY